MAEIPEKYQNAIDVCGNQKVMKLILTEGTAETVIPKGVKCKIHYTGTLLDGTKFDSSVDRGDPFETEIGIGRVIKGWDAVVPTMKINEKASVLIQADYAYGEHGSPPTIPPNSPLIFEIELLEVYGEDISVEKNKGLTKLLVSRGQPSKLPTKDQDNMEKDNVEEADRAELGFYIRGGIVVITKNACIADGMVIWISALVGP